ncbi:C-type lectin domain family 4 member M-like [Neocloeon triangulifer]|uniref:C-type lectin domain family 4 member M-like n=1 Tax=Neocloeon triangulifer TaxID=2078957 RepID=UPI00286F0866|nr:C-type lectin domain family 4 member M-like [Neocloeon triangulifer]XP_059490108.1 C-type lectin domain family 4 member M-like [Neocloeon triangulifer]
MGYAIDCQTRCLLLSIFCTALFGLSLVFPPINAQQTEINYKNFTKIRNVIKKNRKSHQDFLKTSNDEGLSKYENLTSELNLLKKSLEELKKNSDDQYQEFLNFKKCNKINAKSSSLTTLPNGKKYLFKTERSNWTDAQKSCKKLGMNLASTKNQDDLNELWNYGKTQNQHWWWLSGRDYGSGGIHDYRWIDGTELPENSTMWRSGGNGNECVYIWAQEPYTINGWGCHDTDAYFICEYPPKCY